MNKKQASIITFLSGAAFVLAFLISGRLWFRLDLTGNNAYTVSEVSRNLYKEIADQVTITYFISDKLARAHPLPGEIADLLAEYAALSRGKIRFVRRDPAGEELLATVEELGIVPQRIQVEERNETTLATVYTGILIEYLDREAVIPVVFSLDTLEYDLTSRIRSLVRNTERAIGVIAADAAKQWESEYGLLNRELVLAGFRTRPVNPAEEIPPALPALFVLGGAEDLDERALYNIDRYIAGGGRVFFGVDGVSVNSSGGLEARAAQDRGLLAMLANYGVVIRRALVLDRAALNLAFETQSGSGTDIRSVSYPEWIGVREESGNSLHPLSARFAGIDLYWASPLELSPPPGVSADILFTSSAEAWLQTENFVTDPNRVSDFEDEEEETRGKQILGAALSGVFPGLFEGQSGPAGEAGDLPAERKAARIIVVGDADFAGPLMQTSRGESRNLDFLVRAAEWLSSDDDLIAIRGREPSSGRLDRIADSGKRNAVMAFSRSLNTVLIPLGVIIAGLFIPRRRKAGTPKGRRRGGDL